MKTETVCVLCNKLADPVVSTWLGDNFAKTCVGCNQWAQDDPATVAKVGNRWWTAVWSESIAWEEAIAAYQEWANEQHNVFAAILSAKLNSLVHLLSRILRRAEPLIMRELTDRVMATAPRETERDKEGEGSSAGRASGTLGTAGALLPTPISASESIVESKVHNRTIKVSVKPWPVRGGA